MNLHPWGPGAVLGGALTQMGGWESRGRLETEVEVWAMATYQRCAPPGLLPCKTPVEG